MNRVDAVSVDTIDNHSCRAGEYLPQTVNFGIDFIHLGSSVIRMDHISLGERASTEVTKARLAKETSLSALAARAGIPYSTLHRRIHASPGDLTLNQLEAIAASLEMQPADLLLCELKGAAA